jgi:CheY-like chemotaxis protein
VTVLADVRQRRSELAIVDIRMPPTNTTDGIDAACRIREEYSGGAWPDARIAAATALVRADVATRHDPRRG